MFQQGQVFKLKARCADGEPLWAYRYRVAGRGSARLQVGGFSSRAEAQRALQNKLARLVPGGRSATLTLGEWVEEYLEAHQGERVTVAKLRWLLGKATAELGGVRLVELSPEQVCAWRLTVPEGHRFEATQALRQVLNRAVAWKLIEENPAKRGVPNAQVALAWILAQPGVTSPIIGASKMQHLDDAVAALSLKLDKSELKLLAEPYQPHAILGHS